MNIILEQVLSIPPLTRLLLLCSIGISALVSLDLVSPLKLYFNWPLVWNKHEYWRLVTSLLFRGKFSSVHTFFDFFMFYRHSSWLERVAFANKPADWIVFFLFGCTNLLFWAYALGLQFFAHGVSAMMFYYFARKNPNAQFSFFFLQFRACFLPYVLVALTVMTGQDPTTELLGNLIGHIYFYLTCVVPLIPETEDVNMLKSPQFLIDLCQRLRLPELR